MFKGHTPDITPAQITAVLGWVLAQALAFGWISNDQNAALLSGGSTLVAVAWKIADSFIRSSRAKAHIPPAA